MEQSISSLLERVLADAETRCTTSTLVKYRRAAVLIYKELWNINLADIDPRLIFELLDDLRDRPAAANHVHTVLRLCFRHAAMAGLVVHNPMLDIPRYRQVPRDRYITDTEFEMISAQATPTLRVVMDLAYLTAQRIGDILTIRQSDLIDGAAIQFKQRKTGMRLLIKAPNLTAVIRRAHRYFDHNNEYLVTDYSGRRLNYQQIYRQWVAACVRARVRDAHLHDIRAKSVTDADAQGLDPTALAGHTNTAQTRRYLRGRSTLHVTGPDS